MSMNPLTQILLCVIYSLNSFWASLLRVYYCLSRLIFNMLRLNFWLLTWFQVRSQSFGTLYHPPSRWPKHCLVEFIALLFHALLYGRFPVKHTFQTNTNTWTQKHAQTETSPAYPIARKKHVCCDTNTRTVCSAKCDKTQNFDRIFLQFCLL